jgi:carbonic anhydrase/acetyltransferase-like protein (isoleucine patch superfamily)
MTISVRGHTPKIAPGCFLAPTATVIGNVELGPECSLWFNVTLRGDVEPIRVGAQTNIQDGTVIHGTYGKCGVILGQRVTIGHNVLLHGCTIGDGTLVGMGSIVMDQAEIGRHCLVGAGSLVTEGSKFPDNHLIFGRPAKVVRPLTQTEINLLEKSADNYLQYMTWYSPQHTS